MIGEFAPLALFVYSCIATQMISAQLENCGDQKINLIEDETEFEIGIQNKFTMATTCTYTITGFTGSMIGFKLDSLYLGGDGQSDDGYLKVAENMKLLNTTKYITTGNQTKIFLGFNNMMVMEIKFTGEYDKCFVKATFVQRLGNMQPAICGPHVWPVDKPEPMCMEVPPGSATFTGPTVCQYTFFTKENHKLSIRFKTFNVPKSENCEKDYLQITDFVNNTQKKAKYCFGHNPPGMYTSSEESLYVILSARRSWQNVHVVALISEAIRTTTMPTEPMGSTFTSVEDKVTEGTTITDQRETSKEKKTINDGSEMTAAVSKQMNWILLTITLWIH